jgi:hypothetical protein
MLALYQKYRNTKKKKKKKGSGIVLYGFLEVQNHQVSNLNQSSQQIKLIYSLT